MTERQPPSRQPGPDVTSLRSWLQHWRWLLGFSLLVFAGMVILLAARRGPAVPQPVAFNHLKHTQDLDLGCEFCHAYVLKGAHAGLPDAKTCTMCHSSPQGTSSEAARVTDLISQGDPLRFNKLFRLEPHVFYTHRRHVKIAGLECQECHGSIAETERPPARALVNVTMDFCIKCHREQGQSLECNACHR